MLHNVSIYIHINSINNVKKMKKNILETTNLFIKYKFYIEWIILVKTNSDENIENKFKKSNKYLLKIFKYNKKINN